MRKITEYNLTETGDQTKETGYKPKSNKGRVKRVLNKQGLLEKILTSRRRNLAKMKLESDSGGVSSSDETKDFWDRQWVIFDGKFTPAVFEPVLQVLGSQSSGFVQQDRNAFTKVKSALWKEKQELEQEFMKLFKSEFGVTTEQTQSTEESKSDFKSSASEQLKMMGAVLRRLEPTRFIFETRELGDLSPSSLPHFALVHLKDAVFSAENLLNEELAILVKDPRLRNLPEVEFALKTPNFLSKIVDLLVHVKKDLRIRFGLDSQTTFLSRLKQTMRLFGELLFKAFGDPPKQVEAGAEPPKWPQEAKLLRLLWVYSFSWAFGSHLTFSQREKMFDCVRIKTQQFCSNAITDFNSPFEFFFDFQNRQLLGWKDLIQNDAYGEFLYV